MKYYKIINNNEFIGVVTSRDFIKYSPRANCFLCADEVRGEYINLNAVLYRSTWMAPIVHAEPYVSAIITEITEEEYNTIREAINNNEEILIEDDTEEEIPVIIPEDPDITLEFVRQTKLSQMSKTCRQTIENGFDLILRGEIAHFSLTTQDQLNLMNLSIMAQTENLIPYHADGEECVFYSADEINQIISAANTFKNYQLAYNNALKVYINDLDTIEAIAAIEYGTPIPDEYKSDVLMVLE